MNNYHKWSNKPPLPAGGIKLITPPSLLANDRRYYLIKGIERKELINRFLRKNDKSREAKEKGKGKKTKSKSFNDSIIIARSLAKIPYFTG